MQPRLIIRRPQCQRCLKCWTPASRGYSQATTLTPSQASRGAEETSSESRKPGAFALRRYKPITPGLRHLIRPINDHLWKGKPWKPLTYPKKGQGRGGRNNTGHVTVRHRGGGHARRIRTVDFTRIRGGKQTVDRIEYDPNRSAHIALVTHRGSQEKSYILAADGLREGDEVESFRSGLSETLMKSMGGTIDPGMLAARTAARGNCLPLYMIPIGTSVFNVGLKKKEKGILCRSAGTFATLVAKDNEGTNSGKLSGGKFVTVRLQSGEIRKISSEACATIGVASNPDYQHRQLGKAGRSRWLGIRPTVRGVAMNACKCPHLVQLRVLT